MFEPHSFLWHYLAVAPHVLVLFLAAIFVRRSFWRKLPVFFIFAVVGGVTSLVLYIADIMRSVSGLLWWEMTWVRLAIEIIVKFILIGEIFSSVFSPYPSISKLGRKMIRGIGAALVLAATLIAALAHLGAASKIVWGAHLLEQSDYFIECGLLVFIFLFGAYFRLTWERLPFGIAMGLGLTASVELGTWALLANLPLSPHRRTLLDFVNMATYHVSVLIWFYYVLTTPKWTPNPLRRDDGDHRHDHDASTDKRQKDLDVWNRELERLLR